MLKNVHYYLAAGDLDLNKSHMYHFFKELFKFSLNDLELLFMYIIVLY